MKTGRALHQRGFGADRSQWCPLICTLHVFLKWVRVTGRAVFCQTPQTLHINRLQIIIAIIVGWSLHQIHTVLFCDINVCASSTLALLNKCLRPWNLSASRSGRKGVSDPSIKFVYGAAVGQLHADIAAAVRPGEPASNRRPSIKQTVRQYKPLGGREHTRPSSARFIALIYTLHWWIPHKWPIRKAGLKPHPQCHSSLSLAFTSAKKVILCYY